MSKVKLRRPFFVINPKSYLVGDEILKLAKHADELALKYDFDVLFTAQHVDLRLVSAHTSKLIVIAQHMDGIKAGRGMGRILPEGCVAAGAKGSFLNHAEHPMTIHELAVVMQRLNELELLSVVCADSVEEASAIAKLNPDVMVCEPTSLIGTGNASDANYMKSTNEAVKSVSPSTFVLQAAGISSGQNVYDAILLGADGTGGTSGIVAAQDPFKTLDEMFAALAQAREAIKE